MKLSDPQIRVLRAMAQGQKLRYSEGLSPGFFFSGGSVTPVSIGTGHALINRGLIVKTAHSYPFTDYALTEAGTKAVS